jgi:membrane-associated phospholipid phosphatase
MSSRLAIILCVLIVSSVRAQKKSAIDETAVYASSVYGVTEVMFHDVVNPPAAARFYAYASLAAYEVMSHTEAGFTAPGKFLKNYPTVSKTEEPVHPGFAATYAMLETGKLIIPSGAALEEKQEALFRMYSKAGVKKSLLESSVKYARAVGAVIAKYSRTDGYLSLSTLTRYQPREVDSTWYPTPPEYMAAVEPNWRTIRTFFLDSCNQFSPGKAIPFDPKEGSRFYTLMDEVYKTTNTLSSEQKLIAQYWDCNPFANFYSGHVTIAIKKISPGGHWMNIAGIAARKANLPVARTVQLHMLIAMGLHDGFVSCWDEKYQSHRIRPKSAINRYMDERWNPLLETPPFPEYTSGHSVISTVCAEILTAYLGDNFAFTDNTEVFFGLPERPFTSFRAAAAEAAISRLYGGIHFRDAIEQGQVQGKRIGTFILEKMKTDQSY